MIYLIDPPLGHRYGFPKEIKKEEWEKMSNEEKHEWTYSKGYPRELEIYYFRIIEKQKK
jgi:hypothetical protein